MLEEERRKNATVRSELKEVRKLNAEAIAKPSKLRGKAPPNEGSAAGESYILRLRGGARPSVGKPLCRNALTTLLAPSRTATVASSLPPPPGSSDSVAVSRSGGEFLSHGGEANGRFWPLPATGVAVGLCAA